MESVWLNMVGRWVGSLRVDLLHVEAGTAESPNERMRLLRHRSLRSRRRCRGRSLAALALLPTTGSRRASLAIVGVQVRHVHDGVEVVLTHVVGSHIDGRGVRRKVQLGAIVEKIEFLELAVDGDVINKRLKRVPLRQQLLHHFAHGLEDALVVDGRGVEGDGRVFEPDVVQLVVDAVFDVADRLGAVVGADRVCFVDEDCDFDVWVGRLEGEYRFAQARDGLDVVVLRVEDPGHGAGFGEDGARVEVGVEIVDLAWEVPHVEVAERAVNVSVCSF